MSPSSRPTMGKYLRRPPRYVTASILCSLGGFLFGMDTGIIGPVTVMETFISHFGGTMSAIVHGLIVSSILIPAAISSFFGGRLADSIGRGKGIALGALIFGIGAAIEAAAVHIGMFVAGRVVEGVGEGLYLGTLTVYICEIAPPAHRGPLTTGPQLLVTLGLVAGYFVCYGTSELTSTLGWRLPFALLGALALAFAATAWIALPDSPRWLTFHGRQAEARAAWDLLGVNPADRERLEDQIQHEVSVGPDSDDTAQLNIVEPNIGAATAAGSGKVRLFEAFSHDARSRTLLALFLMAMQQLSGIDGVLYYAPILFTQAGLSSASASFLASGVSAIVIFAVTIPATIWADRWSRRLSTIFGGLGISCTMFLIGALYASDSVHANYGAGRWVVVVAIYIFTVIFCISWAVTIKVYAAEIQPQRTRASATNLAFGSNWASNFLVALVTPVLLAKTSFGAYFLFGGCSLLTALVCLAFMPETRGKTLDEIEEAFKVRRGGATRKGFGLGWSRAMRGFGVRPTVVEG